MSSYQALQSEPKRSLESTGEIDLDSHDPLIYDDALTLPEKSNKSRARWLALTWIAQGILFVTSMAFFWSGVGKRSMTDQECSKQLGSYSTAYDAIEYIDIRFQGAILDENPWNGHPNPQNDKAWEIITNQDQFAISEEDMIRLKKPLTQIKWPASVGGGYMASLEVFHQLHCLNSLRQYTYVDYYSQLDEKPFWFKFDNQTMRSHLDHCIDILRQTLMCHGDVGIVTYSWVEGHPTVYPDFSNWHKCRDNVPLLKYHKQNRVQVKDLQPGEGDTILERPPCERAYNDVDPELAPDVCP